MNIIKHGFKQILPDNDQFYIDFVVDALKHSDPDCTVTLHKFPDEIKTSIKPSESLFKQHIIDNLLGAHKLFGIKIIFSKSLAISPTISFLVMWE